MSRHTGDKLEKEIEQRFNIRRTSMSGGYWDNADLANEFVIVECKVKNDTDTFKCPKSELDKLKKQADKLGKDWMYIMQDGKGKKYVLTSLDFFQEAVRDYFKR